MRKCFYCSCNLNTYIKDNKIIFDICRECLPYAGKDCYFCHVGYMSRNLTNISNVWRYGSLITCKSCLNENIEIIENYSGKIDMLYIFKDDVKAYIDQLGLEMICATKV